MKEEEKEKGRSLMKFPHQINEDVSALVSDGAIIWSSFLSWSVTVGTFNLEGSLKEWSNVMNPKAMCKAPHWPQHYLKIHDFTAICDLLGKDF